MQKKHFRILTDFPQVRSFMVRIYERDWRNGVPAPFLEYALSADWADQTLCHRDALWEHDGKIVAFCFYESKPGTAFFSLDPNYGNLADEMMDHAQKWLADDEGKLSLRLFEGQHALMNAAERAGFHKTGDSVDCLFNLGRPLEYPLPAGYRFVEPAKIDPGKALLCCWKGFDHESEGPWDGRINPALRINSAPHATPQYAVAIENEQGEYVCWAGMWWTPENHLAYMEPLCTIPECRRKGLAAAALAEMARRMRPLGATHMTGGANPFYTSIGYEPAIRWTFWERP